MVPDRPGLTVRGLQVVYGETVAVDAFDLDVARGARVALMGPSGCGKTSVLRALAGLEPAHRGSIWWGEERVDTIAAHRRRFGLMFQDYALFPHLDVDHNVRFGLDTAGWSDSSADRRVNEVLELVDLTDFRRRSIGSLSGGEQQRVALARTLAPDPRLIMLDEPIGSLDRPLRERLLTDMQSIFDRIEATVLYVTHDRDEAFAIADEVCVMKEGTVVGAGRPDALWGDPKSVFIADFLGIPNVFPATPDDGLVDAGWLQVPAAHPAAVQAIAVPHDAIELGEHPEAMTGTAVRSRFTAGHYLVEVRVADGALIEILTDRPPAPGAAVRFSVDVERVLVLDA